MIKVFIIFLLSFSLFASEIQTDPKTDLYKEYVVFLVSHKGVKLSDIEKSLNSKDRYIRYYESFLKTSYAVYQDKKLNENMVLLLLKLSKIKEIKNSFEAFLLDDMLRQVGINSEPRVKSPYFCRIQFFYNKSLEALCRKNYAEVMFESTGKISYLLDLKNK